MLHLRSPAEEILTPTPRVAVVAPRRPYALSPRDARILNLTVEKLRGARPDFSLALHALHEAVAESIPRGRVFLLGSSQDGPIFGSLISGIGITDSPIGVQLVHVGRPGTAPTIAKLGRLCR